jgi:Spy/CpxP family protein refolding chaperone
LQTTPNFLPEPIREFAEDMTARNLDLRNGLIDDGIKITRESRRNWRDRNERSKSSQDRAYDEHRAAIKQAVKQREKDEAEKRKSIADKARENWKRERDAEQEDKDAEHKERAERYEKLKQDNEKRLQDVLKIGTPDGLTLHRDITMTAEWAALSAKSKMLKAANEMGADTSVPLSDVQDAQQSVPVLGQDTPSTSVVAEDIEMAVPVDQQMGEPGIASKDSASQTHDEHLEDYSVQAGASGDIDQDVSFTDSAYDAANETSTAPASVPETSEHAGPSVAIDTDICFTDSAYEALDETTVALAADPTKQVAPREDLNTDDGEASSATATSQMPAARAMMLSRRLSSL